MPINPIDVIEINDYVPITELEEILSKEMVFPNSKRLIESLADLSDEERKSTIERYNLEVSNKLNRKEKKGDAIDLGQNIIMDTAGTVTGLAVIGSAFSLLKIGGRKLTKSLPLVKAISAKIDEFVYGDVDNANINYLTKINRVARVKRNP